MEDDGATGKCKLVDFLSQGFYSFQIFDIPGPLLTSHGI